METDQTNRTNCSLTVYEQSQSLKIVSYISYPIQIVLTLFGNLMICWLVYKTKRLRTPANTILVSLCLTDLLQLQIFVLKLMSYSSDEEEAETLCKFMLKNLRIVVFLIQLHLIMLTIDRLFAIKYPLHYIRWITTKKALIVVIVIWAFTLTAFVIKLLKIALHHYDEEKKLWKGMAHCSRKHSPSSKGHETTIIVYSFIYFVPLTIIVVSYTISLRIALNQVKSMYPLTELDMRKKSALKAAKTTAILIGTYFVLYTPSYVATVIHKLGDRSVKCPSDSSFYILRGVLSNICFTAAWVNPLVYARTNADFKREFVNFFRKVCVKPTNIKDRENQQEKNEA